MKLPPEFWDDWRTEADEDVTFGKAVLTFVVLVLSLAAIFGSVLLVAASMNVLP